MDTVDTSENARSILRAYGRALLAVRDGDVEGDVRPHDPCTRERQQERLLQRLPAQAPLRRLRRVFLVTCARGEN